MSLQVMSTVFHKELPPNKKWLMVALADWANDEHGFLIWASQETIASKTGFSVRNLRRLIDGILEDGLLVEVEVATNRLPAVYQIDLQKLDSLPDCQADKMSGGGTKRPPWTGRNVPPGPDSMSDNTEVVLKLETQEDLRSRENASLPLLSPNGKSPEPQYQINPNILRAIDKVPAFAKLPAMKDPSWWKAITQAYSLIDHREELYKMGAWIASNPRKAPRKDLRRFVSNWFAKANAEVEVV